jgi:preprotein translocase subunit Sss1
MDNQFQMKNNFLTLAGAAASLLALSIPPSGCRAPMISNGGFTSITAPTEPITTPTPVFQNHDANKGDSSHEENQKRQIVRSYLGTNGRLILAGDDSNIHASEATAPLAQRPTWKSYLLCILLGMVGTIIVIIAGKIGWRIVLSAAKTSL